MNSDIKIFKDCLKKENIFFNKIGYIPLSEKTFNESVPQSIFFQSKYFNANLEKEITFTFYPTTTEITNNQIEVYVTYNNSSIDVSTFLAYKEVNRTIKHEDIQKYRFIIDPKSLEFSIRFQLKKIRDILFNEMHNIIAKQEWLNIPIYDPRDDY